MIALLMAAVIAAPDYGPQPTYPDAVAISEAAIRAKLVDPQSATFRWPYNFVAGSLKGLLTKRSTGYWTCGRVNSRNKMGGYAGESWVMVVVNNGVATMADVGEDEEFDLVNASCESAIKKGQLPPAPSIAAAQPGKVGIQFQPSPIGALLLAVAPGSAADRAGLRVGQLITAVDGKPLAGLTPAAMIASIQASGPSIAYSVMGVGEVRVQLQ